MDRLSANARQEAADRIAPRLAAIFTHAAVGLCELDAQGRFVLVNQALCRLLGCDAGTLRSLRAEDVTHPDDLEPSRVLLAAVTRDGCTRSIDKRFRCPDGRVVWARVTVTRLRGLDEPGGFLAVIVDMTEQRRAELALQQSEQRARTLIEGVARSTWETDGSGRVVDDSPSWRAQTGQALATWLDDDWLEAVHPDDREYARRHWREALAARRPVNAEFRLRRALGGYEWVNVRAAPVIDDAGQVHKWVVMSIDISARKSAEAALRASELRLQTLVGGVPQLVWRAVDGGHWTWASPQWEAATGQSRTRSEGFGWLDAVHPEDRDATLQRWSEAAQRGALEVEHRLFNRGSGRYCWFQTRASPVRDDDGTIIEWLGTSTDVDDLRGLQERQRILVAELQHRTRNLLGLVNVISDKTLQRSADFADYRLHFRERLDALARVQGLLSRLDENEVVTLDRLVHAELGAHGMAADLAHVSVDGPAGLALRPSSIQPLAMALHELATNAVKYGVSEARGGHLAVVWYIQTETDGSWLHIDWRETGAEADRPSQGPGGSGQGRELIERALPYQLHARTRFELTADGVHCHIAVPAARALTD